MNQLPVELLLSQSQGKRRHVSDSGYDISPPPEQESLKPSGLSQQIGEQALEPGLEFQSNYIDLQPITPGDQRTVEKQP